MGSKSQTLSDKGTRVLLADDHTLFREGTRAILEREGFDVIGEASDGAMAVRLVQELHPDVAVLDIGMPVLNGIEAVKEIRRSVQGTHTVLLTVHEDEIYMVEALKAGAHGYVLKTQSDSDLVQSIRAVALGAIYLAPGISGRVMHTITSNSQSSEELSVRERQVLEMIAQGKTTREIAATLSLSPKTIESHRGRIMQKLDLHQMAQLVSYAVRHQLIKT